MKTIDHTTDDANDLERLAEQIEEGAGREHYSWAPGPTSQRRLAKAAQDAQSWTASAAD